MGAEHLVTVNTSFLSDRWDVACTCGFKVANLGTHEAAVDTANWHQGLPSALGDAETKGES